MNRTIGLAGFGIGRMGKVVFDQQTPDVAITIGVHGGFSVEILEEVEQNGRLMDIVRTYVAHDLEEIPGILSEGLQKNRKMKLRKEDKNA